MHGDGGGQGSKALSCNADFGFLRGKVRVSVQREVTEWTLEGSAHARPGCEHKQELSVRTC